jgi:hypothetical protein
LSFSNNSNDQFVSNKNRPNKEVVHTSKQGKWISNKDLQELALKKYHINGNGITFANLMERFACSKEKAQRRLKNACQEKRDKNGKKFSIMFRLDDKRTSP